MVDPTLVDEDGKWLKESLFDRKTNLERQQILAKNPVLAAIHFVDRFECYLKHIVKHVSEFNEFGEIVDEWIRFEFQARGSVHVHFFLWSKKLDKSSTMMQTIEGRKEIESLIEGMTIARADYARVYNKIVHDKDESLGNTFNEAVFLEKVNRIDTPRAQEPVIIAKDVCHMVPPCPDSYCFHNRNHESYNSVYVHPSCRPAHSDLTETETLFDVMELIKHNQNHFCTHSCFKYDLKKPIAERVCRYHFPKDLHQGFEFEVTEKYTAAGEPSYDIAIHHDRKLPEDQIVNAYNALSLLCWRSNIDIQFVGNKWGAAVYAWYNFFPPLLFNSRLTTHSLYNIYF